MDVVNAKKTLESYINNKKYYEELLMDIDQMKENQSRLKNRCANVEEINARIIKFSNIKDETLHSLENVENTINSLNQPSKNILYQRYIKGLQHYKIALRLNYSTIRIYQLLNIAIKEFVSNYTLLENAQI